MLTVRPNDNEDVLTRWVRCSSVMNIDGRLMEQEHSIFGAPVNIYGQLPFRWMHCLWQSGAANQPTILLALRLQ